MLIDGLVACSLIKQTSTMGTPSTSPHYSQRHKTDSTKNLFDQFDKPTLKRCQSSIQNNKTANVFFNDMKLTQKQGGIHM